MQFQYSEQVTNTEMRYRNVGIWLQGLSYKNWVFKANGGTNDWTSR